MEPEDPLTTPKAGYLSRVIPAVDDSYPGVGHAVQAILASTSDQDTFENLHRRAHEHLKVFDDPRYAPLDTPLWVTRLFPEPEKELGGGTRFTVRNVVKAMYDTAEDLGLDRLGSGSGGRRYVAAAICACATDAKAAAKTKEKDWEEALARGLQRLASTWAAFLLWPFYAHGWLEKRVIYPEGRPSGLTTPAWFSKATLLSDENLQKSSQLNGNTPTLGDRVFLRDGYRCVLTGFVDHNHYERLRWAGCTDLPGGYQDDLKPVHFFKRSLAVYSSPSGSESGRDEFDSMAVTLEILQHYCQLDRKYVDDAALMAAPKNAIAVTMHFQKRFEYLTLCLKPTPIPYCYEVKDYVPRFNHLKQNRVPSRITFKSHYHMNADMPSIDTATHEPSSPGEAPRTSDSTSLLHPPTSQSPHEAIRVPVSMNVDQDSELEPDPELIRVHAALTGVLHLSGAFRTFSSLFQPLAHSGRSAYPSSSGSVFWRSVVEYEGPKSCVEVELREAVGALQRAVGEEASLARAARSVE